MFPPGTPREISQSGFVLVKVPHAVIKSGSILFSRWVFPVVSGGLPVPATSLAVWLAGVEIVPSGLVGSVKGL